MKNYKYKVSIIRVLKDKENSNEYIFYAIKLNDAKLIAEKIIDKIPKNELIKSINIYRFYKNHNEWRSIYTYDCFSKEFIEKRGE